MEFRNNEPIYLQVIHEMKLMMIRGVYHSGEKLPSTRDLAVHFQINQNTAVRVYQEMERMGYCFTKRGLGTFITEDRTVFESIGKEYAGETVTSYIQKMSLCGYGKEEMKSAVDEYYETVVQK